VVLCTLGFGVFLLLASVALIVLALQPGSSSGHGQAGGLILVAIMVIGLLACFSALTGMIAGVLGYAAGFWLTRLAKSATASGGR
jgi:hypothetical protein